MRSLLRQTLARLYRLLADAHWSDQYRRYRHRYDLHPTLRFNGRDINLAGAHAITVGRETYIGARSSLNSTGGPVRIGDGCAISHDVRVYTSTYVADADLREATVREGPVTIGDAVWIGFGALVAPNVTIGDNAVVGANSVVNHDVEPWTIVAGVPATVVRRKRRAP